MDQISQLLWIHSGTSVLPHPGLETSALGLANLLADDQPWSLPETGGSNGVLWGWNQKKFWMYPLVN